LYLAQKGMRDGSNSALAYIRKQINRRGVFMGWELVIFLVFILGMGTGLFVKKIMAVKSLSFVLEFNNDEPKKIITRQRKQLKD
jgi:hypothetical protein